jgi:hypothetical protein
MASLRKTIGAAGVSQFTAHFIPPGGLGYEEEIQVCEKARKGCMERAQFETGFENE